MCLEVDNIPRPPTPNCVQNGDATFVPKRSEVGLSDFFYFSFFSTARCFQFEYKYFLFARIFWMALVHFNFYLTSKGSLWGTFFTSRFDQHLVSVSQVAGNARRSFCFSEIFTLKRQFGWMTNRSKCKVEYSPLMPLLKRDSKGLWNF